MIPVTYPSSVSTSKESQMVVFALSSVAGLQRWTDYIPVKYQSTGSDVPNSFNTNGYIACDFITNLTGKQAWVDYVPVFVDNLATTAWQVSDTGFIPFNTLAGGGTYVSLDLNFINATALDSRITFSRGTNATLTGSNGLIQWAPHNLLTNSEDFEAAVWDVSSPARVTITTNQTLAPDGASTADLMTETTITGTHRVGYANVLGSNVQLVNTVSCFYKQNTGNAFALLSITDSSGGNQVRAWFNLQTGAVGTTQNVGLGSGVTATIVPANNGFWRCSVSGIVGGTGTCYVFIGMADADNSPSYTGSTGRSVFIWGAQLNVGALQSYNPTTPKNLLGFTQEPENAAWTKSNSYVQQNLLTWSQDFDNAAWTKGAVTITSNTEVAPDGTMSADGFFETTVNASHQAYQGASCTSGTSYTMSVYAKQGIGTRRLNFAVTAEAFGSERYATFNLDTATATAGSGVTASIISVGNGWFRCVATVTATATATSAFIFRLATSNSAGFFSYTGDGTSGIYIWGAQLVQGSTAGDYTQTTSAAAPTRYLNWDGTLTGRKLVEDATTGLHRLFANITLAAVTHTATVYAKAGERSWIAMRMDTATGVLAWFNVATGVVGTVRSGLTASIQSVGGGWYRCSITGVAVAANNYLLSLATADNVSTYTGDGTSGIYVSDFQLSNSASVDPYVYNPQAAAASAAYYGPRFDYDPVTLASRGLLIEEQRTNLLTYSEDWTDPSWARTNVTVTPNAITSPSGAVNASKLEVTTTSATIITKNAAVTGTSATYSIYVKQGSGPTDAADFAIRNNTTSTNLISGSINYSTGVWTYSIGSTGVTVTNAGNNWWKLSISATSGITSGDLITVYPCFLGGVRSAGTFAYVWGAQLEAGSFATSYIPTVASQVTRNADSASMLGDNFYTWYNPNQGTLYFEGSHSNSANFPINVVFSDASSSNNQIVLYTTSTASPGETFFVRAGNVIQANINGGGIVANNVTFKLSGAYKTNDFAVSLNGGSAVTDTNGSVPTVDRMFLGASINQNNYWLNGHIRRINYYNTRLDNATLQALTT